MLSQVEGPPFDLGITWSTVRLPRSWPQYWHVHLSLANTARRVILRLCASRGMRTYVSSLITTGRGSVKLSACSTQSLRSSISARCLRIRIAARLTVQTLIGSYEALRTSTRPRDPGRCSGRPDRGSAGGGPGSESSASGSIR